MTGQLYINNTDAYTEWGVMMDTSSLSTLMTPPAVKEYITNESRLADGTQYLVPTTPKIQARDLTLTLQLVAPNETTFFSRYTSFVEELQKGTINIRTSFQPDVTYKCLFVSCNQFTQFMRGIAKFSLKLVEPNPKDRTTPLQ